MNMGYRLLRFTVRVEPADTPWLQVPAEFARGPVAAIEPVDVPIEVTIPGDLSAPLAATLLVEGNGGTQRVEVRVEPSTPAPGEPEPDDSAVSTSVTPWVVRVLARVPIPVRLVLGALGGVALRALIAGAELLSHGGLGAAAAAPRLGPPAVLLGVLGSLFGASCALRRDHLRDFFPAAFAGGFGGILIAALLVAICQTLEVRLTGSSPIASLIVNFVLWAAIGAGLAGISAGRIPYEPTQAKDLRGSA
jgi:hypothetical protein